MIRRDSESGFITLTALIILAVLSALALSALSMAMEEGGVSGRMLKANQVRMAARAAARIVGAVLTADKNRDVSAPGTRTVYTDVGVDYDGLNEAWFHITRNSAGSITPYSLGNGAYFDVQVFDMSGRTKPNAIVGSLDCAGASPYYGTTTDCAREMVDALPCMSATGVTRYINNNYWTAAEGTEGWDGSCGTGFAASANFREINAQLSPFNDGSAPADYKFNVNTADVFDNMVTGDPPDVTNSAFKQFYASTGSANSNSRRMVRMRRSGCAGTACDATTWDAPDLDYNPVKTTANWTGTTKTMGYYFNSNTASANFINCGNYLATSHSEGWFLVVIEAWIVKDLGTPSPLTAARAAEYNVFTVIYRTATGARTEQWREWFIPAVGTTTCATYDDCNSLMLHDAL